MNRITKIRLAVVAAGFVALAAILTVSALTGAHAPSQHPAAPAPSWTAPAAPSAHPSSPAAPAVPAPPTTGAASVTDGSGEDPAEPTATVTADPDLVEAATAFAASWLNTYPGPADVWLAKLTPKMTADLAAQLTPDSAASVPAGVVGYPVTGTVTGGALADMTVPVVTGKGAPVGTLTLQLLRGGDRWLVSDIDWTPA